MILQELPEATQQEPSPDQTSPLSLHTVKSGGATCFLKPPHPRLVPLPLLVIALALTHPQQGR